MTRHLPLALLCLSMTATAMILGRQPKAVHHTPYYWPSARGLPGAYSQSPYAGPKNLTADLLWEWHHPESRYGTVTLGAVIDDEKNVYLSADDGIRKFSPDGHTLWYYAKPSVQNNPSLMDGALYGSSSDSSIFSLSMATGEVIWSVKPSEELGGDTGFINTHDGIIVAATDRGMPKKANQLVRGLSAKDGSTLWTFKPEAPLWNFLVLFPDDGTFVYQDIEGRAYRNSLHDGSLLWKSGGHHNTWTDGTAMLGSNGIVYTVAAQGWCCDDEKTATGAELLETLQGPDTPGWLSAYRLEDGQELWSQTVPRPPNVAPAVGHVGGRSSLSVVIPIGRQCGPFPTDVYTFDAETGVPQWHWKGPTNKGMCAGDAEGMAYRNSKKIRSGCFPNPWSDPTIDSEGTIYTGNQDGNFFAIRDVHGDGSMIKADSIDTKAAFSSPGSAHAPGMLAIASCDGLFVFKGQP